MKVMHFEIGIRIFQAVLVVVIIVFIIVKGHKAKKEAVNKPLAKQEFQKIEKMYLRDELALDESLKKLELKVFTGKLDHNGVGKLKVYLEELRNDSKTVREKIKKYEQEIYPPNLKGEGK